MMFYTFAELAESVNKNIESQNHITELWAREWMVKNGWIVKDEKGFNVPSEFAFVNGLLSVQSISSVNEERETVVDYDILLTGKGQQYFINLFLKGGNANG